MLFGEFEVEFFLIEHILNRTARKPTIHNHLNFAEAFADARGERIVFGDRHYLDGYEAGESGDGVGAAKQGVAHGGPVVIGAGAVAADGHLALVEQEFDEDVAGVGRAGAAVEDHLDVAGHREDLVGAPLRGERVEVVVFGAVVAEVEKNGERHDHCLVAEAQIGAGAQRGEGGVS